MRLSESLYQQLRQPCRIQNKRLRPFFFILYSLFFSFISVVFSACAESDGDEAQNEEFAYWQARNDAYFATLEDSLSRDAAHWQKIKTYTKDELLIGPATDYIYIKVLESGSGSSPLYSDSVRVAYRGRLIPSKSYAQGYVFDQTYYGTFNRSTIAYSDNLANSFVDGFTTALQHMRRGDRWLVYIPYQLGYDSAANGAIPAYSTLIFDLALLDFGSL